MTYDSERALVCHHRHLTRIFHEGRSNRCLWGRQRESFCSPEYLQRILEEAQAVVDAVIGLP